MDKLNTETGEHSDGAHCSVFAIHAGEWNGTRQWHTGEFDRGHPPCGYVDDWAHAVLWQDRQEADSYAAEFGGTVVEFRLREVLPNGSHLSQTTNDMTEAQYPCSADDAINALLHMADDHECCRLACMDAIAVIRRQQESNARIAGLLKKWNAPGAIKDQLGIWDEIEEFILSNTTMSCTAPKEEQP